MQLKRYVLDFIEKDRSPVRELESSNAPLNCARKRAPLVAKHLALEQSRRNRSAIHFNQGTLSARAQIVDRPCDQFLAGSCFAINQNSRISSGDCLHFLQNALENRAAANDFFKIVSRTNFFLEVELFFFQLVFERIDLAKGQGVLHSYRDLFGYLTEELGMFFRKRVLAQA